MKLRPDQLANALSDLQTVYAVGGDDPLLVVEAADAIRSAAKAAGYTEREVLHVETGFNWQQLDDASRSMSLFSEKKLIELHMPTGSPGREGSAALKNAVAEPTPDTIILLICGALDSRARKSAWWAAIEKDGAAVYGWAPKPGSELQRWVDQRMRSAGVQAEPDAIELFANRVEGNLLAAAQDIEKLALLFGEQMITAADIEDAVADHARFAVFDLIDRALGGDLKAALRTMDHLRAEGVEPHPLIALLAKEARQLASIATAVAAGESAERACGAARVFRMRVPLVVAATRRHNAASARWLLAAAARADRTAKGAQRGQPWDDLVTLVTVMAAGSRARGLMQASDLSLAVA